MKKVLILFTITLLAVATVQSQNCKAYIPYKEGTKLELTSYDKKGKIIGTTQQELIKVEEEGNGTIFTMYQKHSDKRGDEIFETNLKYKCIDNVFYVDMSGFVNQEQMRAYEDMDIKISMEEIDIPAELEVGQKLKDGSVTMDIISNSPINLSFIVKVQNRLVEAKEEVTTPAGTFNCVKISQEIHTKSVMSFTMNSIDWYAEGVGLVKSEIYRKGKLMDSTKLTKFEKP